MPCYAGSVKHKHYGEFGHLTIYVKDDKKKNYLSELNVVYIFCFFSKPQKFYISKNS